MPKDSVPTSQDHDRKHQMDHISQNPRAAKDLLTAQDQNPDLAEIIEKGHALNAKISSGPSFTEDKRELARQEHTNHFTNRATEGKK